MIATLAVLCAVVAVAPASAEARAFGSRTLKRGSVGSDVKTLQRFLTRVGFRTSADGIFGNGTYRTVRSWESAAERRVDGRVTRRDARVLRRAAASVVPIAPATPPEPAAPKAVPPAPGGTALAPGAPATGNADGTAPPPASAPAVVQQIILAGNAIARKPYKYGGGHGRWNDSGYDCSGSVSYALHGAGLLKTSLDSTGFESYGAAGAGKWVTIYGNAGHAYMVVAGLRFDTSGASSRKGSRWTTEQRSSSGYV